MATVTRLGFVGLRNIGKNHVRSALKLGDRVAVAGFADTDAARLREACEEFGEVPCHAGAEGLFADPDVDAVVLALPNHLHAPLSIEALKAGKDVLIEKPIARSAAEANEMIAARDQAGRVLMVGMNQRFQPEHQAVGKAIAEGVLGEIYYARTRWCLQRPFEGLWGRGDWFLSAEEGGGGAVLDLGVHRLDLVLHLMGFPAVEGVYGMDFRRLGPAEARRRGKTIGIEDAGVALVRLQGDRCLYLEASYFLNCPAREEPHTLLCGEKGFAELGGPARLVLVGPEGEAEVPLAPDDSGATSCAAHFVDVLQGRRELIPTAEQGRLSLQIIEGLYESSRSGRCVALADSTA